MLTLGVDIGSTTSKAVLLDGGSSMIAQALIRTGIGSDGGRQAMAEVLARAQVQQGDLTYVAATGYGRNMFKAADEQMSELSCHAKGVHYLYPGVRTIIDIGGQDAKVISLNERGQMLNFLMNDKCAAGTGRFLDVMSNILDVPLDQMGDKARSAAKPCQISSTCTVFAESEVISQLANGESIEDVIAGICYSVASRVASLAKRLNVKADLFMSGGVALNGGVRDGLSRELGLEVHYSELSQLTGAIGAAVYAFEKASK